MEIINGAYEHHREKSFNKDFILIPVSMVETAIINNIPIRVFCPAFPGQESLYSVEELKKSVAIQPFYNGGIPDFQETYRWKFEIETEVAEALTTMVTTKSTLQLAREEINPADFTYAETEGIDTPIKNKTISYAMEVVEKEVILVTRLIPVTLAQYIGNKLRRAREAKGLEQKDMILLSVKPFSITNLKNLEKGEGNPMLSSIEIACDILNLHIAEVFPPKI